MQQQTFEFVTFEDAHRARSYAMRQSWRKRKQQKRQQEQLKQQEGDSSAPKNSNTTLNMIRKNDSKHSVAKAMGYGRPLAAKPPSQTQRDARPVFEHLNRGASNSLSDTNSATDSFKFNTANNYALGQLEDLDSAYLDALLDDDIDLLASDEEQACIDDSFPAHVQPTHTNTDIQLYNPNMQGSAMPPIILDQVLSPLALDPFDTFPISLTIRHHELLHHWLNSHAGMMFGESPSPVDFNPMRDVWFPLDLSNAASFYGILAHAAAHLAYLNGQKDRVEVLQYKSEAVSLINAWMQDGNMALSDATFAAVVRLLTFERYWGTEAMWRIHRDGLDRMIQARGGLSSLKQNWRLGLVLQLISLMSKPSWFYPSNNISEISDSFNCLRISEPQSTAFVAADHFSYKINQSMNQRTSSSNGNNINESNENPEIAKLRSLWLVSFIQDMRSLMANSSNLQSEGLRHYHSIYDAVTILRRSFLDSMRDGDGALANADEHDRIACLFYIGVMTQECVSARYHNTVAASPSSDGNHDDEKDNEHDDDGDDNNAKGAKENTVSATDYVLFVDEKYYDRLATLDKAMREHKSVWMASITQLEGFLLNHFMNHLGNLNRAEYVSHMTEVLTSLSREARNGVERCLLNMFSGRYVDIGDESDGMGGSTSSGSKDNKEWTVDELLMSIHGG